jgi:hypothetical protein
MIRAIESCHAWLEELAWHIKVTPRAFEQPSVGARIAFIKVQAGRVSRTFSLWIALTSVLKVLELCVRESQQIFGG